MSGELCISTCVTVLGFSLSLCAPACCISGLISKEPQWENGLSEGDYKRNRPRDLEQILPVAVFLVWETVTVSPDAA